MAIQKKIDMHNVGIECEIWRVVNVPIFRDRARVAVAGWLNMKHYDDDLDKTKHLVAQQYDVEDKPEVAEQLDENGEMKILFQPAKLDFTDYFSDVALLKKNASPLSNGYNYLLTLPEFEGGTQV